MKSKKIGLLIPNLQSGGAERVLSLTSNLLSNAGYDVYFFLYDTDKISYDYSGKLIDLKSKAGSNIVSRILIRLIRIIKLSYYKYKFDLDIVISFLYSANVVNFQSIGRAKRILACRGYSDFLNNGKKYSIMINKIDSFIVQTERMKLNFISDFNADASKINVLYNPFDIELIIEKAKEDIEKDIHYFIDTHKTICTVGSFKRDKGYWHLIKSFIEVKKSVKDAGLIFIGHRGELEKEIRDMANLSEFKEDILFLRYQENPFKYVSKCDVYVCSSIYEGFPNALVEAMACGIAVVSTDCRTGPREILHDDSNEIGDLDDVFLAQYGILVPAIKDSTDPNDIKNQQTLLARAIQSILTNKELASIYSEYSLMRSMQYDISMFSEIIIEFIELILIKQ